MTSTSVDVDGIRALATDPNVTPGPWSEDRAVIVSETVRHTEPWSSEDKQPDRKAVAYCGDEMRSRMGLPFGKERDANAAFIAACDPQTIIALLDKLASVEAALTDIIAADEEFRASMAPDVEKDPVTLACDRARSAMTRSS